MLTYTASAATLPKFIYALPLSGAAVTGFFVLLNQWKKVSIHAAAASWYVGRVHIWRTPAVNLKVWSRDVHRGQYYYPES